MTAGQVGVWGAMSWVVAAGCGDGRGAPAAQPPAAVVVGDSGRMVGQSGNGDAIWLVTGRTGATDDGRRCDERLIEIRRDTTRLRVPLLYTGDTPRVVNDSTLEAVLWLRCAPGDTYRVSLRTGQPVKHRAATSN